jgi:hypothetical protein
LRSTSTYKVVETLTDNRGKFSIFGVLNPFVNRPTVVIYKKGYIAWDNQYIFPNWEKRKDWQSGAIIRLEKFNPDYSNYGHKFTHYGHMDFLDISLGGEGDKIRKASEWERKLARNELYKKVQVNLTWTVIDDETEEPVEGAMVLIRGTGYGYPNNNKDIEMISNKKGEITIERPLKLIARPPMVTIYKKGYVVWNSKVIFPNRKQRKDFKWQEDYMVRLKKWNSNYRHVSHFNFIRGISLNSKRVKTKLGEAIAWEEKHGNSRK